MKSPVESMPGALRVSPLPPFRLKVELRRGKTVFLDLEMLIRQWDAYWRLRQYRYFSMVSVDILGGICWPEGEGLAPDGLDQYVASK